MRVWNVFNMWDDQQYAVEAKTVIDACIKASCLKAGYKATMNAETVWGSSGVSVGNFTAFFDNRVWRPMNQVALIGEGI